MEPAVYAGTNGRHTSRDNPAVNERLGISTNSFEELLGQKIVVIRQKK
jgi:hypothetical protein